MAECVFGPALVRNQMVFETARKCYSIARRLVPPCAQSSDCPCGFTESAVEDCNKALWCVGLQIQHYVGDLRGNPRDTRVAVDVVRKLRSGFLRQHYMTKSGLVALALLRFLFQKHHCLVSLELFDVIAKHSTVFVGLERMPTFKRPTIVVDPDERPFGIGVMASLLLALLEQREFRITALDLTGLAVEAAVAEAIVDALPKNKTLTDLAVASYIFASGPEFTSSEHFAWYLMQKESPMRRLHLDATADIGLFGRVLGSNASLRVLDVRCRPCCDQGAHQPHLLASEASVMASWASGLKRHCYLRRLAVGLSLCPLEDCRLFIGAIANAPVDAVTVRNVADDGCLQALYATIRQHDPSRKVIVEDHHVGPADVKLLRSYPEASVVTISSSHFHDLPSLCGAIRELAVYDEALYSATADVMLVLAPTVRDMELYVKDSHEEEDESRVACQNRLIKAVTSNRNLTRLKLHVEYLNATCCQFIADSVLDSWVLCELSMEALESSSYSMLLWCLCPGVTRNHSLLVVTLPDRDAKLDFETATLHDVTRRNRHYVMLASRFVILYPGGDPYGRDVLPLVAKHPKLAKTIALEAGVTETVAESMIADALQLAAPCPNA
ncbi:hypothetical protein HPB52_001602 [Rhipicephalus sanguineus]|uniref:Uncharacterized protein n=1 Tax=Rhipicephalus sanguineus TaxID=34632 RepID=A0A9D4SQ03_RHISA|nr:hypothetical protein HPB52_001602 [Rhipicephalus sanguineus]